MFAKTFGCIDSIFSVLLTITLLLPAIGHSEETKPAAETAAAPVDESAVEGLVRQLGDDSFARREEATSELIKIGVPARPALKRGVGKSDPEIRFRCQRILTTIAYNERFGQLEAFADDVDGKLGLTLPGWERFSKVVGTDKASRRLFVEMQRAEAAIFDKIDSDPKAASDLFAQRCRELQQSMRFPQFDAESFSIAALLFFICDDRLNIDDQTGIQLYSLCNHAVSATCLRRAMKKTRCASCSANSSGTAAAARTRPITG